MCQKNSLNRRYCGESPALFAYYDSWDFNQLVGAER